MRRLVLLTFAAVVLVPTIANGNDVQPDKKEPGTPPLRFSQAFDLAKPRLFRLQCEAAQQTGTAFLLQVRKENGQSIGYFATCYHVVEGETGAVYLYRASDESGLPSAKFGKDNGEVHVVPELDLVLLRLKVPNDISSDLPTPGTDKETLDGYAFGFPGFNKSVPFQVKVRVTSGRQKALLFDFLRPDLASKMEIRFLGNELTYPGMSGGPVLDSRGRYAGMLLGRMPEPSSIPVFLPSDQVLDALNQADKQKAWNAFDPKRLRVALPYKVEFTKQLREPYLIADQSWSSYEQWLQVLGDDPADFLRSFQEVSVPLHMLRDLKGVKTDDQFRFRPIVSKITNGDSRPSQISFRWNGQVWESGKPASLRPGENLLIVTKSLDSPEGLVINDLFRFNQLDVDLLLGDTTVFRIKRSLPAIIRKYSIFVTIHNGDIESAATNEPYSARLAVRLDYLNELLNRVPFELPIVGGDARSGLKYHAMARAKGKHFTLRYVSPQSIDAAIDTSIAIKQLEMKYAGVRVTYPSKEKDIQDFSLRLTGRIQIPSDEEPQFFFVAPRALAGTSKDPIPLPILGDTVEVDVGPIVREALVCYVNKELLIPDRPASPGPDSIRDLLVKAQLLSGMDGFTLKPLRVFLKNEDPRIVDDPKRTWIIMTFVLVNLKTGKAAFANLERPSLLPEKAERSDIGIEFVAHKLPLSASGLQVLGQKKNIWAEHLRVSMPATIPSWKSKTPAKLDVSAKQLADVTAGLFQKVIEDSPKSFTAELSENEPLQLFRLLPAGSALLENDPKAVGRLTFKADAAKDEFEITAGKEGYNVLWPKMTRVKQNVEAENLTLRLDRFVLKGAKDRLSVSGNVAGEFEARKLVVGNKTFIEPRLKFSAVVDSGKKSNEQLAVSVEARAKEWLRDGKSIAAIEPRKFTLTFGSGTSPQDLEKKILDAVLKSFLMD